MTKSKSSCHFCHVNICGLFAEDISFIIVHNPSLFRICQNNDILHGLRLYLYCSRNENVIFLFLDIAF